MKLIKTLLASLFLFAGHWTLFAGELPIEIQVKLIKFIAHGVGSENSGSCKDAKLVAALESIGVKNDAGSKVVISNLPAEIKNLKDRG